MAEPRPTHTAAGDLIHWDDQPGDAKCDVYLLPTPYVMRAGLKVPIVIGPGNLWGIGPSKPNKEK